MLATPAVRLVGLYSERMEQAGLKAMFPGSRKRDALLAVIKAVKAGDSSTTSIARTMRGSRKAWVMRGPRLC